jgi:16S rRNA (adenine1518-N6/adenine1519-N6)-dimethyltransferase
MRQVLEARDIRLTKSLGQNFLHDGNQLRRIVTAAALAPTDRVLEIGPGLGPLTELLIAGAGHVLAIERDWRMMDVLRERFAGARNLELLHADALEFLQREPRDWPGWKLVANLPYSVASPILVELARPARCPEWMVVTLQREVADRLAATAGNKDYGLLTLLVQRRYQPENHFRIPASCFFPAPDIDSACITLRRRPTPLLPPGLEDAFERIIRRAFSQRRKMMLKLLKHDWPADRLEAAFEALGLSAQARAESVPLDQFVQLTRRLCSS